MLHYRVGNIVESEAVALVNTINTVGVMGKGIALRFKEAFPNNFKRYVEACKQGEVRIGQLLVTEEQPLWSGVKTIINFPTKEHWRNPSQYAYIEEGLVALVALIEERNITSIAIPPLGAGNGGLDWVRVRGLLVQHLSHLACEVYIYEPNDAVREVLKKERARLTPARAMLLSVLYETVHHGEFVSEFAAEKIAYFLQRFGATDEFKLQFHADIYGPYSGKVKHVLYHLNGSYIMGYGSKDAKPFEELDIVRDAEPDILSYLATHPDPKYQQIVARTNEFLYGFYSSFSLELLATVDFIMTHEKVRTVEGVMAHIANWNERKRKKFDNPYFLDVAIKHLKASLYANEIE